MLRTLRALAASILPLVVLALAVFGAVEVAGACELERCESVALATEVVQRSELEPTRPEPAAAARVLAPLSCTLRVTQPEAPWRRTAPLRFPLRL